MVLMEAGHRYFIASVSPTSRKAKKISIMTFYIVNLTFGCETVKGLNPAGHFKSRLSLIVRVNVVLNRTVVVDSD